MNAPTPDEPRLAALLRWAPALLGVATFGLYASTVTFPFVDYDDPYYVVHNPHLGQGLDAATFAWAWTSTYFGWWHPVTWLSHLLDVRLFGSWAGGHHLTSALLHALNAVLAVRVLERFGASRAVASLSAALFAWHPMRVESVAWISERKDVLGVTFALLMLLAWARWRERSSAGRYAAVVALFVLALASKAMDMTLPAVLVVLEAWRGRWSGLAWRRLALEVGPLFALSGGAALLVMRTQTRLGAVASLEQRSLVDRLVGLPVALLDYLATTAWPAGLSIFYPPPRLTPLEGALAGALVLAVTLGLWRLRARLPHLLAGWLAFCILLSPVLGLVQTGAQFIADRYTYLAHLALFAGLVASVPAAWARRHVAAVALSSLALLAGLVVLTERQLDTWVDTDALYQNALAAHPDNVAVQKLVASEPLQHLLDAGRFDEAVALAFQLQRRWPGDARLEVSLGTTLARAGRFAEAIRWLERTAAAEPWNEEVQGYLASAREDLERARSRRSAPPPALLP